MMIRSSSFLWLFGAALLALARSTSSAASPVFEETFNEGGQNVRLVNGAAVGGSGSGVSGKPEDASYEAAVPVEGGKGPLAKINSELPSGALDEITFMAWYKLPAGSEVNGASLFNSHGAVLFWDKGQWKLRVNDLKGDSGGTRYYESGPMADAASGEWKFLAVTWSRADNTAIFYSGDKAKPTDTFAAVKQNGTAPELTFGEEKFAKVIGNTFAPAADGTFPGNLDNFRIFGKALDGSAIEKVRQADTENKAPSLD